MDAAIVIAPAVLRVMFGGQESASERHLDHRVVVGGRQQESGQDVVNTMAKRHPDTRNHTHGRTAFRSLSFRFFLLVLSPQQRPSSSRPLLDDDAKPSAFPEGFSCESASRCCRSLACRSQMWSWSSSQEPHHLRGFRWEGEFELFNQNFRRTNLVRRNR